MSNFRIILFSCFLGLTYIIPIYCQWERTMEFYGNIGSFTVCPDIGGTDIFAGTDISGVFLSTDYGSNWNNSGLADTSIVCLESRSDGEYIFAGTYGSGVCRSMNRGFTWSAANIGLSNLVVRSIALISNGAQGLYLFAGTDGGLFISYDFGSNWTHIDYSGTLTIYAITSNSNGTNIFIAVAGNGVLRSTNHGTTWTNISNNLPYGSIYSLAVYNDEGTTNLFASAPGGGIFRTTDYGTNWVEVNNGLTNLYVNDLTFYPETSGNLFAGTAGTGVFLSTDNGTNWSTVNDGLGSMSVNSLTIGPDGTGGMYLFAGTINNGNGGGIWRRALSEMILVSTTLTAQALAGSQALEVESINGFNIGDNIKINPGGPNEETNTITGFGSMLLQNPLQFDHSIGEIVLNLTPTSVEENNSSVPLDYVLFNNYPNPFNPSTKIKYSIPQSSYVAVKVYDVLGNEVATLVDEYKPAGRYEVEFIPSPIKHHPSSGVYLCRLQTDNFSKTIKMLYLK
jgi:photosystem II stability/assembly factor-like uncharacterized protein